MSDPIKERLASLKKDVADGGKGTESFNGLITQKIKPYKITAEDLGRLIESNPEHKVAKDFAKGIRGLSASTPVVVDRTQLMALIQNVDTIKLKEQVETEDGIEVVESNVLVSSDE